MSMLGSYAYLKMPELGDPYTPLTLTDLNLADIGITTKNILTRKKKRKKEVIEILPLRGYEWWKHVNYTCNSNHSCPTTWSCSILNSAKSAGLRGSGDRPLQTQTESQKFCDKNAISENDVQQMVARGWVRGNHPSRIKAKENITSADFLERTIL